MLALCAAIMLVRASGENTSQDAGASPVHCKGVKSGCVWRQLKVHKYNVGESVLFVASNVARPAAEGLYEIIRQLPYDGDDCQYRIKSKKEAFERVARESQLEGAA